jgi:glycosyltransferase involved in cell wall biosynthesis
LPYFLPVPPLATLNLSGDAANFLLREPVASEARRFLSNRSRCFVSVAPVPISAIVLTKNSARLLPDVLAALAWCDEVVVYDTGSTDDTLAVAAAFPHVRSHQPTGSFAGFGVARQHSISLARNDWIFSVDSDEIVSPELADEIRSLPLDPRCVYVVPFENFYRGRHITTCGWSPDRHERLFNRTVTNFCHSEVHERVQTKNLSVVPLRHPIRHFSYQSTGDFLRKMSAYSHLFAAQHTGKKRSSPAKAVARSVWAFFKSFVLERGFFQGADGLVISAYKSQTVFWKYLLLHEANQR